MYLVVLIKCKLYRYVVNLLFRNIIKSVGGGSTIVYNIPSLGISVGNERSFAWSSRGIWFVSSSERVFAG